MWDGGTPRLFELDGGRVAIAYGTRVLVVSPDHTTRIYFPALGLPSTRSEQRDPFVFRVSDKRPQCPFTSVISGSADSIWGVCNNSIVKIDADGNVHRYRLPFDQSDPGSLMAGSDGSIWFVETTQSKIGRIAPDGQLHEIGI